MKHKSKYIKIDATGHVRPVSFFKDLQQIADTMQLKHILGS